jgi:hypothetical protein
MRRVLLVLALTALVVPAATLAADDPIVTVPADMTVEAQSSAGAVVTFTASATDHDGNPIAVTCTPASGSIFGFGETRVNCTATEDGHSTTKHFEVTVDDRTPPAITVPAPMRVSTTSRLGKVVSYPVNAIDLVDGPVDVACTPAPGQRFALGTTTVTCSASDRRRNAGSSSFTVTVVRKKARAARSAVMLAPHRGATVTGKPLLRWRGVRKASFYNVQLYRNGHKVLSAWPTRPRLRLRARWTFQGHTRRLKAGSYTWLVWPAFGSVSSPRYGKLMGQSTFVYART